MRMRSIKARTDGRNLLCRYLYLTNTGRNLQSPHFAGVYEKKRIIKYFIGMSIICKQSNKIVIILQHIQAVLYNLQFKYYIQWLNSEM